MFSLQALEVAAIVVLCAILMRNCTPAWGLRTCYSSIVRRERRAQTMVKRRRAVIPKPMWTGAYAPAYKYLPEIIFQSLRSSFTMAASKKTLSGVPPRLRESKQKWLAKHENEDSESDAPPSKKPRLDNDEHTATTSTLPLTTNVHGNTTSAGTTSTNTTNILNIPSSSSVSTTSPIAQTSENTAPKPQATDSSLSVVSPDTSAHSTPLATVAAQVKIQCRWMECDHIFEDHDDDVARHLKSLHRVGSSGNFQYTKCLWEECPHKFRKNTSPQAMAKHVIEKHFKKELAELTGVEWVEKKGKKRKEAVKKDVQAAAPEGVQQPKRTRVPRGTVQATRSSPRLAAVTGTAASAGQATEEAL
ncbi:hypothetical protein PENSPDRAFT_658430 [Peniophora sp. CONT]|nr:hypothetical protein PENSPDRAFT_658430 [Peniophora sp. CONT]